MLIFIGFTLKKHNNVNKWGRKVAILTLLGLVVCCLVAVRDGYYLSVQASFDKWAAVGLFTLDSIQSTTCCIGGAIIALSSLITILVKKQKCRKVIFYVLSATIIIKMLIIEISRMMM
jgi:hypothetical protein